MSADGIVGDLLFGSPQSLLFWWFIVASLAMTAIGYLIGFIRERAHLSELAKREEVSPPVQLSSTKRAPEGAHHLGLVTANVVLATDSFRVLSVIFRRLFGGRIKRFELINDRARREVLLRIKDRAHLSGADAIYNLRLELSEVRGTVRRGGGTSVEVLAYGTALKVRG